HDAAALTIRIAKRRQVTHGLALGIDGLAAALRVIAPVRNETPAQRVERDLSSLMIAPDDQQFLARCGVPARRVVMHPAVAHVHAVHDGVSQWSAALDDSSAHN